MNIVNRSKTEIETLNLKEIFETDVNSVRILVIEGNKTKVTYSASEFSKGWLVRKARKAEKKNASKEDALKALNQKISYLVNLKGIPLKNIKIDAFKRIAEAD